MKKMLALLVVCTVLAGYVSPVFAGAAGWQNAQSRMRKAHKTYLKQQAEYWKKFDAEMALERKGAKSKVPESRRTQPSQPE